jgi:hypothetical protein
MYKKKKLPKPTQYSYLFKTNNITRSNILVIFDDQKAVTEKDLSLSIYSKVRSYSRPRDQT